MKKPLLILLVLLLSLSAEPWGGRTITIAAGTAVRIVSIRTIASSLFIQANAASSGGVVYILYAPVDVTCSNGGAGTTLIATLQSATSTAPGGNVTIPSNPDPQGGVDISGYCVDGAHTGDTVTTSWNIRN